MKTLFGKTLDEIAIERIEEFEPPEGYVVAYSGGKDSEVILDLVRRSGVKYKAIHNLTTCDPPELVRHVKEQSDVIIDQPPLTMWQLIRKKKMPPRRNARFCCAVLKEGRMTDCLVMTGVRWQESARRKERRMVEACFRDKTKKYLHPIIDWLTEDVWSYLHDRKIQPCCLYAEGFRRLGCVLCPMKRNVEVEMARWPKIARAWERSIKATFNPNTSGFASAEELWRWWLDRDARKPITNNETLFFRD